MRCRNPACATDHFPRLDPAIIVLVSDGERALLGRQATWPEGRFSTIAGFVEPGESLEDAVAREVLEETGVQVLEADYHSSQPWPFPGLAHRLLRRADGAQSPRADEELEECAGSVVPISPRSGRLTSVTVRVLSLDRGLVRTRTWQCHCGKLPACDSGVRRAADDRLAPFQINQTNHRIAPHRDAKFSSCSLRLSGQGLSMRWPVAVVSFNYRRCSLRFRRRRTPRC
jgi:8-oxo-dGTP pyrophosphatase MutT (NUDIX family)